MCARVLFVCNIRAHGYEHAQQVEDARGTDMHTLTVPVDVIPRQGPLPKWKSKAKQRCSLLNSRIHVLHMLDSHRRQRHCALRRVSSAIWEIGFVRLQRSEGADLDGVARIAISLYHLDAVLLACIFYVLPIC